MASATGSGQHLTLDSLHNGPEHLTLDEVAQILRTPPGTLRYWRHLGTGPKSFKIGRRVLYRRDDVRVWYERAYSADDDGGRVA